MSVLKSRRVTSKTEYLKVANDIYLYTISFLTRLSARYSRLIASDISHLAGEVVDYAERANNIFPSGEVNKQLRKEFLLRARSALSALDVRLTSCYLILNQNPQGAFGKNMSVKESEHKLDYMADMLGGLIDREKDLINAVMESDKKRK